MLISYEGRNLGTRRLLQRTVKVIEVLVERSEQRALRIRVQPAHSHVDVVRIKLAELMQPRRSEIGSVAVHTPIVRPRRYGVCAVQNPDACTNFVQPPRRARAPEARRHARGFEEPARDGGVEPRARRARAPPVDEERDGEDGLGVRGVVARRDEAEVRVACDRVVDARDAQRAGGGEVVRAAAVFLACSNKLSEDGCQCDLEENTGLGGGAPRRIASR